MKNKAIILNHKNMFTPDLIVKKIDAYTERHLSKFEDVDSFLTEHEDIVVEYFYKQADFKTFDEFRFHLRREFERYKMTLPQIEHEDQHEILQELIDNIAKKYPRLMYFGEIIPNWAREKDEIDDKFSFMNFVKTAVAKFSQVNKH